MPYQGVAFFFVLGVGIATAALMYLLREQERLEQPYGGTGNTGYDNNFPPPGWQRPNDPSNSSHRRRRRRPNNSSGSAPVCVFCIEVMCESGPPCKILRCGHTFHAVCIDRWAESKRECPVCRSKF